jgi:hypothetical protein
MNVVPSSMKADVVFRPSKDLLRSELRRVGEEFLVVQDREAFGRDLERKDQSIRRRGERKIRRRRRTSQKSSCNSNNSCTTLAAEKLSSLAGSFPFAYKMFGEITVARFCKSILLPVSSSTCEKDATHLRKTKRTSIVSRWDLGGDEEVEKLESHERVREVAEELLEEGGELDGVVVREVDAACIAVERFGEVLQSADVAVLAEDTFDRHVCASG